jgi:hypothetical protein
MDAVKNKDLPARASRTRMELISVHIPKTGGVSFRQLLQRVYGAAGVVFDYADRILDPGALYQTDRAQWERTERRPFIARVEADPDVRVIHGHFAARKYGGVFPEAARVVWLREPVARLVSHYHYWRGLPHGGHGLHRRLLEENLSLEEFASLPLMQDSMSRQFLEGVGLEGFDFVGRQEFFDEDLAALARLLGWVSSELVGPSAVENRSEDSAASLASLDGPTRQRLQELNPADIALYRQASELAARRNKTHS